MQNISLLTQRETTYREEWNHADMTTLYRQLLVKSTQE
jgi:hypothetical protein